MRMFLKEDIPYEDTEDLLVALRSYSYNTELSVEGKDFRQLLRSELEKRLYAPYLRGKYDANYMNRVDQAYKSDISIKDALSVVTLDMKKKLSKYHPFDQNKYIDNAYLKVIEYVDERENDSSLDRDLLREKIEQYDEVFKKNCPKLVPTEE